MSLSDRLIGNSVIKMTSLIGDSKVYQKSPQIPTSVPMINVALSGKVRGGIQSGLLVLAGPSKHFKTAFALLMAAAYLKADPEAVLLFYDSEFGTPQEYFGSFGIDMGRVIHSPITSIEELKHDIMAQLQEIKRKDKVIIIIDSIGNLASLKEIDDAEAGKSVADMTRAKQLKSVFRMVTPKLTILDIPLIAVNHTYKTQETYSRDVVSGGTGIYYSANDIWIIGRQQEKDSKKVLQGWNFIINIEKSREVLEKSKIPITVTYKGGIQRWSGLREVAEILGYLTKVGQAKWSQVDKNTGEVSEEVYSTKKIDKDGPFWKAMLTNTDFAKDMESHFCYGDSKILQDDDDKLS